MSKRVLIYRVFIPLANVAILSLLIAVTVLPSVANMIAIKDMKFETEVLKEYSPDCRFEMMNGPGESTNQAGDVPDVIVRHSTVQENPEAYFPNFLYYSTIVGNAIIDYLYDNITGGFYRSSDEHWTESSIVTDKYTYDQAQAIQAFLKISQAVINETERDYAIQIANETANYMLANLWDNFFGGFIHREGQSVYKRPGIQGKAIQALVELFIETKNQTFLDKAQNTTAFMNDNGWDHTNGGYFYLLSHSGTLPSSNFDQNDPYVPASKRVDHNAIMGEGLLALYSVSSDSALLSRAVEVYQAINATSRNDETGLFYTGVDGNNKVVEPAYSDVFVNSLVLEFLSKLYDATGESIYYDDFFSLLTSVLNHFWDDRYGGFYATYSYDPQEERDVRKYTERQFYAMRALDEAYKLTNGSFYYNIILDMMEILLDSLYDEIHEGFYQIGFREGVKGIEPDWNNKFTVTNSLAIYEMANVWLYSKPSVLKALWSPSQPRPEDPVEIITAAFDANGIASVLFNYSMNGESYQVVEMEPHPLIGNMYRMSFDKQPDGTTVDFNIVVKDKLGNEAIRGLYSFIWQEDTFGPVVEQVSLEPSNEVGVHKGVKMSVIAFDVPSQGYVISVSIHYHEADAEEELKPLTLTNANFWDVNFEDGFEKPLSLVYYFVAIDGKGNIGKSPYYSLQVYGRRLTLPLELVVLVLFTILLLVPMGLYVYAERKKKQARVKIREIKQNKRILRTGQRGTRRR
ncbi:MAG: hypothetical protein ACFFD4_10100 [Candidatus Odinarchaeota archaeon]